MRGGMAGFSVARGGATITVSLFGVITVTAGGVTQTMTVPGLQVSTSTGGTPGAPTIVVQGDLSAALGALVGNSTAAAATLAAIQTLVAYNLGNAARRQAPIHT